MWYDLKLFRKRVEPKEGARGETGARKSEDPHAGVPPTRSTREPLAWRKKDGKRVFEDIN
jgi:hypothetical protein